VLRTRKPGDMPTDEGEFCTPNASDHFALLRAAPHPGNHRGCRPSL